MNVHAAALAKAHRFDEQTTAFAGDVIDGLSQHPKRLPPKYFYDATGSELFEQITLLPEYYPTRTELSILRDRAGAISAEIPDGAALVEFGAGATTKVRLLLNECKFSAYVPVDISGDFLKAQADALRRDFLNVLVRINRELGGNFDLSAFMHRAIYNRERHRIEMHLISKKTQTVRVLGRSFSFRAGESIHTESSYKYSLDRFTALARGSGWSPRSSWTDGDGMFSVHALVASD